tara:strand:- start:2284 stop:2967 length:684 start_codon:yes stop_codon:yes gene_type:complete
MNKPQPIILAGGLGTRLRDVVKDKPKVLASVNNKPFITYLLDKLIFAGFDSVFISTGYKGNMISEMIGSRYKTLEVYYSNEESPLGTGGAVKRASKLIDKDKILVLNGDTYISPNINKLIDKIDQNTEAVVTTRVKQNTRYNSISIDHNNHIISFNKETSKKSCIINSGLYLLCRKSILEYSFDKFSLEDDYIPYRLIKNKILSISFTGTFIDIGIPSDYFKAQNLL